VAASIFAAAQKGNFFESIPLFKSESQTTTFSKAESPWQM
jgi:hypothetical protein